MGSLARQPTIVSSPEHCFAFAKSWAQDLPISCRIGLAGEVGAGKTVFTKGVCAGLGLVPETITSPTYTIINRYVIEPRTVLHADLYRLTSREEVLDLDLFGPENAANIYLIEWCDMFLPLFAPFLDVLVHIDGVADQSRRIRIEEFPNKGGQATHAD